MLHIGSFPIFRSNYNLLSFCIFCLILRKMCVSKCTCFPSLILSSSFSIHFEKLSSATPCHFIELPNSSYIDQGVAHITSRLDA